MRVEGLEVGVQGLGFRVWGSGFGVQGLGFRVWGSGFRGSRLGLDRVSVVNASPGSDDESHARLFVGVSQSQFLTGLSTYGNSFP